MPSSTGGCSSSPAVCLDAAQRRRRRRPGGCRHVVRRGGGDGHRHSRSPRRRRPRRWRSSWAAACSTATTPVSPGSVEARVLAAAPRARFRRIGGAPVLGAALLGLDAVGAATGAEDRLRAAARRRAARCDRRASPTGGRTPRAVDVLAAGGAVRPVWENQVGGITFEVSGREGRRFIKWAPAASPVDPRIEAERLSWAAAFTPVPVVLGYGGDNTGTWLVTGPSRASPRPATDGGVGRRWRWWLSARACGRSTTRCRSIGARSHGRPTTVSPSPDDGLRPACVDPAAWHEDHRELSVERALATLRATPPVDRPVVCHGGRAAPPTHWWPRRTVERPRRSGLPRCGRPVGGSGHRHVEHGVELRERLGGPAPRRLRHRARSGAHALLPPPLGPRTVGREARPLRPSAGGPGTGSSRRRPEPPRRPSPRGGPRRTWRARRGRGSGEG